MQKISHFNQSILEDEHHFKGRLDLIEQEANQFQKQLIELEPIR
jgi:hypothetical protein